MTKSKRFADSPLANQLAALEQRLGPIEYRAIGSLTPYTNNPRKHSEKQLIKLGASIEQFGFAMPALIDEDGVIIVGEARIEVGHDTQHFTHPWFVNAA